MLSHTRLSIMKRTFVVLMAASVVNLLYFNYDGSTTAVDYEWLSLLNETGMTEVWLKDIKEYYSLFRCCNVECTAENTSIATTRAFCVDKLEESVSKVKCEISKGLLKPIMRNISSSHNKSIAALVGADCQPQVLIMTCEMLSLSTLPCTKAFRILQFNYHTQFHCLNRLADQVNARRSLRVPKIYHQVWLYNDNIKLEFYQYISMIATLRYFRPELIFFWNEGYLPNGQWWQEFIGHLNQNPKESTLVIPLNNEAKKEGVKFDIFHRKVCFYDTVLVSIVRQKPGRVYGHSFIHPQHQSDIVRLEASLLFGGFYADVDAIPIKHLDPLLNYPVSMAYESDETLTNMAILGERFSPHFYRWHHDYVRFMAQEWAQNSLRNNMKLAKQCPEYVNIEKRMLDPVWERRKLLYLGEKDLSNNFVVHLYWRYIRNTSMLNPLEILKAPHLGPRIFRTIYYLCEP